jgi:actin-like protein 6A
MRLSTEGHPIMLAEPSFNSKEAREKAVELLFEKYDAPGQLPVSTSQQAGSIS